MCVNTGLDILISTDIPICIYIYIYIYIYNIYIYMINEN